MRISIGVEKTEDGKLDPNFCLIIFDLQMPSLGKIVSRMQVQNRTINLYIFCEDDKIEHLSQPFVDLLKENLKKLNYQLAAIKFEKSMPTGKQIRGTKSYSTCAIGKLGCENMKKKMNEKKQWF